MEILKNLKLKAESRRVSFIVIGGHAMNALGYSRQTGDLDLLVSNADKDFWISTISKYGYQQVQAHPVFARFKSVDIAAWPIDFMFVSPEVFSKLLDESSVKDFGDTAVLVPCIKHMIALKLHALKQRQAHRETKDLLDIQELLRMESIEPEELRQLCEKYDRMDLYEQLRRFAN